MARSRTRAGGDAEQAADVRPALAFEACRAHREAYSEGARLIAIIGPETFRLVQEAFGGRRVWIPKVGAEQPCKRCPARDRRIRRLRSRGESVAALAERFGLSPKRVYGILEGGNGTKRRARAAVNMPLRERDAPRTRTPAGILVPVLNGNGS